MFNISRNIPEIFSHLFLAYTHNFIVSYCYVTRTKNAKLNELFLYYVDQKHQTE